MIDMDFHNKLINRMILSDPNTTIKDYWNVVGEDWRAEEKYRNMKRYSTPQVLKKRRPTYNRKYQKGD